jgi:hypothetical protein
MTDQIETMNRQMEAASMSLARCKCGGKVVMQYAPGCTYIVCLAEHGTKMAMADWEPTRLAEMWNEQI